MDRIRDNGIPLRMISTDIYHRFIAGEEKRITEKNRYHL